MTVPDLGINRLFCMQILRGSGGNSRTSCDASIQKKVRFLCVRLLYAQRTLGVLRTVLDPGIYQGLDGVLWYNPQQHLIVLHNRSSRSQCEKCPLSSSRASGVILELGSTERSTRSFRVELQVIRIRHYLMSWSFVALQFWILYGLRTQLLSESSVSVLKSISRYFCKIFSPPTLNKEKLRPDFQLCDESETKQENNDRGSRIQLKMEYTELRTRQNEMNFHFDF